MEAMLRMLLRPLDSCHWTRTVRYVNDYLITKTRHLTVSRFGSTANRAVFICSVKVTEKMTVMRVVYGTYFIDGILCITSIWLLGLVSSGGFPWPEFGLRHRTTRTWMNETYHYTYHLFKNRNGFSTYILLMYTLRSLWFINLSFGNNLMHSALFSIFKTILWPYSRCSKNGLVLSLQVMYLDSTISLSLDKSMQTAPLQMCPGLRPHLHQGHLHLRPFRGFSFSPCSPSLRDILLKM